MKFTCLEAITLSFLVQVGCCEGSRIVGRPCIMKLTYFLENWRFFLFYFSIMKFTCLEAITMPLLVQVGCCESWRIVGSPCIIKLTSFWLFSKAYRLWQFTNLSEIGRSRYFHQPLYLRFILDYCEIHLFLTFSKDNRLGKLTIFWIFFF